MAKLLELTEWDLEMVIEFENLSNLQFFVEV